MTKYLLVAGSVTYPQYKHAREDMWLHDKTKAKVLRLKAAEWLLEGIDGWIDEYELAGPKKRARMVNFRSVRLAPGLGFPIPLRLVLEGDPVEFEERVIRQFLNFHLRKPVGAVVLTEDLWLSEETELWRAILGDVPWYCVHAEGWVESV